MLQVPSRSVLILKSLNTMVALEPKMTLIWACVLRPLRMITLTIALSMLYLFIYLIERPLIMEA